MNMNIFNGDIDSFQDYLKRRRLADSLQDHGFPVNPVPGVLYDSFHGIPEHPVPGLHYCPIFPILP